MKIHLEYDEKKDLLLVTIIMTFKSNMNYCAILCATIILPPSAVSIFCVTRKSYWKYIEFKGLLAQIFLFDCIINEKNTRIDKV